MPSPDDSGIDLTQSQPKPAENVTPATSESDELTNVHELEKRIAPRKAGAGPIEY
jgi:hypothetical protein